MATYNVTVDQAYYDNLSAGAKEGLIRTAISSAGPKIQADLIKNAQEAHKSINITSTSVKVTLNANATFRDYNWKFSYGITVNGSAPGYLSASGSSVGLNPPVRAVYTYKPEIGGDIVGGDGSFKPPEPTNAGKVQDLPFYQNLVDSGQIGSFDDLSQAEFDYLQDVIQRGEVSAFDNLIGMVKDAFMGSNGDSYRDVVIKYDADNPDIVSYYGDNGLDTSKDYYFNMDGIRVGYSGDNGAYVPVIKDAITNSNGGYNVSSHAKNRFLTDGDLFIGHTTSGSAGGGLSGSSGVVANVGTGAVLGLLASGAIDNLAENTVNNGAKALGVISKGISHVVKKGQEMYHGFTSSGDRNKDLFNHQVQSQAYQKGMNTVVQGGAGVVANGGVVSGKVDIDFGGKSIPVSIPTTGSIPVSIPTDGSIPLSVANSTSIPVSLAGDIALPMTLPVGSTIPITVPSTQSIPLNITGQSLPLGVTGKSISLDVADSTKVKLDIPDDAALPVEGLDDNFKAVFANKALNIPKTDKHIENILKQHELEYTGDDGGIRGLEGNVAHWVGQEYTTEVAQGLSKLNKIQRDIKSWLNVHSTTQVDVFGDSTGSDLTIPQGLIPALGASGLAEGVREMLIHQANTNASDMAKGKQRQKDDSDDQDDTKSFMDLFSILFSFTSSVDESLLPDEVKGVLDTFKSLGLSKHTIGGGS